MDQYVLLINQGHKEETAKHLIPPPYRRMNFFVLHANAHSSAARFEFYSLRVL